MLKILVKAEGSELFNPETNEFASLDKDYELCLEHSLVSISKWESKWHKPFLDKKTKSQEELLDYVRCMTVTQNVPDKIYFFLNKTNFNDINKYLEDPMTATTFTKNYVGDDKKLAARPKEKIVTSELIYSWMIELGIPFQFEKWHINRLMTLIRVRRIEENNQNQKMSKHDTILSNKALNDARKAKYNTRG